MAAPDVSALNDSELRALVRAKGFRVPYFTPRTDLIGLADGSIEPGPPSLIERHRFRMLEWAAENWDDIYYQVECPLPDAGCLSCPDFTVANCLVLNSHIAELDKEVESMVTSWTALLVALGTSDRARAAEILKEAAQGSYDTTTANKLAVKKVATAALDVANGTPTRPTVDYMSMRGPDFSEQVTQLVDGKQLIPSILATLADLIEAGPGAAPAPKVDAGKTKKEKEKGDKPGYYSGVVDARSVTTAGDDDDDDDDDAPPAPPVEAEGAAPLPPNQDPARFAKNAKPSKDQTAPPTPSELKEMAAEPGADVPDLLPPSAAPIPLSELREVIQEVVRNELQIAILQLGSHIGQMYHVGADSRALKPRTEPHVPDLNSHEKPIPELDGDEDED